MAAIFFDTSAFVKRYLVETGSEWVHDLMRPSAGNRIYLAWITGPEVISSLTRSRRRGDISQEELEALIGQFEREWDHRYRRVDVNIPVIRRAMALAKRYGLRGYDSVQLSAAIELAQDQSITFISADENLNTAAAAERLAIENPNNHP
ncbi:MAG: type II toxin-antitoxin system VapC family toxin [Candidatus Poribacteria bacterium]|nr:type II toxin-antitoxin system VapC family toxin [Candidatus Poribacteria bacterium]